MSSWQELFPKGRQVFYEGKTPGRFVAQMKKKFNFDPSADPLWNATYEYEGRMRKYRAFHLPGHLMDKVYGNAKYPLGS